MSLSSAHDGLPLEAAELAAAMLRFQEPLAHVMSKHTSEGMPVVGVDSYAFVPSPRPVPRHRVAQYLAALPSPAVLAPTTSRGIVSLILLQELVGERRAAMQRELDNQSAALSQYAASPDTERVLLEFDERIAHLLACGGPPVGAALRHSCGLEHGSVQ